MKRIRNFVIATITITFLTNCSVNRAIKAPTPVDYKQLSEGISRTKTISLLGYPKETDYKGDLKIDSFEFFDGYNSASKARILLYLAGGVFSAGLSEFIFWPLESAMLDSQQCRGTVTFNTDNKVVGYEIYDNSGEPLWFSPVSIAKSKAGTPKSSKQVSGETTSLQQHSSSNVTAPNPAQPLKMVNSVDLPKKKLPISTLVESSTAPTPSITKTKAQATQVMETSVSNAPCPAPAKKMVSISPSIALCMDKVKKSAWYSINSTDIKNKYQDQNYTMQLNNLNKRVETSCIEQEA